MRAKHSGSGGAIMQTAVIFDLDGVLVSTVDCHYEGMGRLSLTCWGVLCLAKTTTTCAVCREPRLWRSSLDVLLGDSNRQNGRNYCAQGGRLS